MRNEEQITVLMIDDDPLDRRLVKDAFRVAGQPVEFLSCNSAAQALELLGKRRKDHLPTHGCLLDINMPGISGIELLQMMKADTSYRNMPVIMFSTSDRDEDILACYDNHAAGYIRKPEQHAALQDIISNIASLWAQHTQFTPQAR